MKKRKYPEFTALFQNCLDRGCSKDQLQDFIERSRRNNLNNPEVLRQIDETEASYSTSLEGAAS